MPDRVLRAMAQPTIDHRSADFAALAHEVLGGLKRVFKTTGPVVDLSRVGTGAWEAALVNTLSPGDRVLAFEIGEFARLWAEVAQAARARRRGRRHRLDAAASIRRWSKRPCGPIATHRIRAVLVVHNETSTGATSRLAEIRQAIDRAGHPALAARGCGVVAGSIDLRHDEWGIDVTLAGSQKGLMLPPGLSFNAISEKALAASRTRDVAEVVLGVGADARPSTHGLLPLHAGDESPVRPARGAAMLRGGRA